MEFNKENFIKRLKEIRNAKNMTQENVAEHVGIATSNYSHLECGDYVPKIPTLSKITEALDVFVGEVFDYEHFNDEKFIDEMNLKIYNNFSLEKKQCIYKIFRALEDFN